LPEGSARAESSWARFRRRLRSRRVRVRDDSMRPTLVPGDRLYVDPRPARPLAPGDVVVARDPERPGRLLVKRVGVAPATLDPGRERPPNRTVYLVADSPGPGRDSRHFGPVDASAIVGVAWFRYAPASRRGSVAVTFK